MSTVRRTNLLGLDAQGLARWCVERGEKPFRARQLMRWVHRAGVADFDAMTDIAKSLRAKLALEAEIAVPPAITDHRSADGTRKWLLDVGAGNAIETVFIPESNRGTLCVSTQAGCTVDCLFCSTGKQGFARNLTAAEIVGQLWMASRALEGDAAARTAPVGHAGAAGRGAPAGHGASASRGASAARGAIGRPDGAGCAPEDDDAEPARNDRPVSNVVFMGMGEPLQNYDATLSALRIMLDDDAYGLSRRRVTVSTSGVVPMMDRLRVDCPVALAVSLHAPNDALRDELVPLNRKYPLAELMAACRRYLEAAPRDFITFEYVMLDGINDTDAHARELLALVADVPCKFNLIPWNPFPGSPLGKSRPERVQAFAQRLMDAGIVTTVRKTRGDDIDAACGQLAGEIQDRTKLAEKGERAERAQRLLARRIPIVEVRA